VQPPDGSDCEGLIVQAQSGFFSVEAAGRTIICQLRGKLKKGPARGDLAAPGDRVRLKILKDGSGVIESIEERRSAIVRLDPRPRGLYRQVLLANPDQALFVFACAHPEPRLRMLDRFLVVAEKQGIESIIVANKLDLVDEKRAQELFAPYVPAGYRVMFTSVQSGAGIPELARQLTGRITVLAGPSGAGKSSILNAIRPGLSLDVTGISSANKGQHTTVVRRLISLGDGRSYVADTPGWKSLALWDTQPEELDGYFPEIRPLVADCRFNDCTHISEPGCAVRLAAEQGRLHPARYDSYVRLRFGQA
jgi:ribosome biogenesis GTPase / thiamine phosphate phosphatase